jgi:hypothetical protein
LADHFARVLVPHGVLAVWAYELAVISSAIDAVLRAWYRDVLGDYWPPERLHVETQYRDIGFPYPVLAAPEFSMTARWTRSQFSAYLGTWSAVKEFRRREGHDAMPLLLLGLRSAWPEDDARLVSWPVTLLAGQIQR